MLLPFGSDTVYYSYGVNNGHTFEVIYRRWVLKNRIKRT